MIHYVLAEQRSKERTIEEAKILAESFITQINSYLDSTFPKANSYPQGWKSTDFGAAVAGYDYSPEHQGRAKNRQRLVMEQVVREASPKVKLFPGQVIAYLKFNGIEKLNSVQEQGLEQIIKSLGMIKVVGK